MKTINEDSEYYEKISELLSQIVDRKHWTNEDIIKLEEIFKDAINSDFYYSGDTSSKNMNEKELNKKAVYLKDKISAYVNLVTEWHPRMNKRDLINDVNKKINEALEIFK